MRAHRSIMSTVAVVGLAFLAVVSTGTHTVRRGETLVSIAAAHDTTVAALVQANGIANANRIYAGQDLTIPSDTTTPPSTPPAIGTTYIVRFGDTLGLIASRSGVSLARLLALNALPNPNLIRIGLALQLPIGVPPTNPPPPQTPTGGVTTHVVRAGDTISSVAVRYGISPAQLIAANGITDGRLYTGQQLRLVPVTSVTTVGGTTYTVVRGDTLSTIARRFGTTVAALLGANGIVNPNSVAQGRSLRIPTAGTGGGGASMRCPVEGSVTFMNDWGFPRSGGRFHEGNDLFAPRGRPAVATVSGEAVQSRSQLGGNQVRLYGDDGVSYYYTHLDRFGAGGRVTGGTVIGYVGNSGNASGGPTHVHFEVHPGGGVAVNPYPRLVAAC